MNRLSRIFIPIACALLVTDTLSAQVEPETPLQLEVFDVRDILVATRAEPDSGELPSDEPPEAERLARFLRTFAEPSLKSREDVRGLRGGQIVVRADRTRVEWVGGLLDAMRANHDQDIFLTQMQVVQMSRATHERIVAPIAPAGVAAEIERFSVSLEPGEPIENWRAAIESARDVDRLMAPAIATRPLMEARMEAGESLEIRQDYDSVPDEDGSMRDELVRGTVFDGLRFAITAASVGTGIAASISFASSEVERPIPEFTTRLASGRDVTVDLPVVRTLGIDQALVLIDGGLTITSIPKDDGSFVLFCVQVRKQRGGGR